jgi:hypothetical protein
LPKYCQTFAKVLRKYCQNIAQDNIARILPKYCMVDSYCQIIGIPEPPVLTTSFELDMTPIRRQAQGFRAQESYSWWKNQGVVECKEGPPDRVHADARSIVLVRAKWISRSCPNEMCSFHVVNVANECSA